MHSGSVTAAFGDVHVFYHTNSVEKQLSNFRNVSVSHCFRSSSLSINWNNLGLSYHKCMKRNLEFGKSIFQETRVAFLLVSRYRPAHYFLKSTHC